MVNVAAGFPPPSTAKQTQTVMSSVAFFFVLVFISTICITRGSPTCSNVVLDAYTLMHRDMMLNANTRKRFLVSVTPDGQGLSDRLAGLVTHFLMAIVTRRAILFCGTPLLSTAFPLRHEIEPEIDCSVRVLKPS